MVMIFKLVRFFQLTNSKRLKRNNAVAIAILVLEFHGMTAMGNHFLENIIESLRKYRDRSTGIALIRFICG
jgi:hypothetical protein